VNQLQKAHLMLQWVTTSQVMGEEYVGVGVEMMERFVEVSD